MLTETLSITGVICLLGFALSALFTSVLLIFGYRLTRRALRVIDLGPEDHPWLQAKISELSAKLNISPPKVGFTEDLRPNAFTTGYRGKTTLVFSAGLFGVLSRDEVAAVALHELSHVKNQDFFYKALSSALVTVSFFNPLAYFASSAALREREMLADEGAAKLLEEPSVLRNALAKACRALGKLPKEPVGVRVAASLFVSSSALPRPRLLSVHPSLDERLRNIPESASSRGKRRFGGRRVALAGIFSLTIILLGVIASYGMVKLQSDFMSANPKPMNNAPDFSTLNGGDAFLKRLEGAAGGGFVRSNGTFGIRTYPIPSDNPVDFGVVGTPGVFVRSFGSVPFASPVLGPFNLDVSTRKELSGGK